MSDISLNFGAIKESVLKYQTTEMLKNEKNNINSFVNEVKNNVILKKQYLIFKALNTDKQFKKERLAERFINQTLEILNGVKWNDVIKENRNLRLTHLSNAFVGSTSSNDKLYNAIHTLMECKCLGHGKFDISKEQDAFEIVLEHLMSEKEQITESEDEPNNSWEYITKIAYSNFNKRYSHLSESEIKLVKILTSPVDYKISFLDKLKQETLNTIKESINKEKDEEIIDVLKKYEDKTLKIDINNTSNLDECIMYCEELKQTLNN